MNAEDSIQSISIDARRFRRISEDSNVAEDIDIPGAVGLHPAERFPSYKSHVDAGKNNAGFDDRSNR